MTIPADEVSLYFDAGNDLFNGSQGVGDNRDWLADQGADYTTAEKFVNLLESID